MKRLASTSYDKRHGGPYDRGSADRYYRRAASPHYFVGATHQSKIVKPEFGSFEWKAYMAGYEDNGLTGDYKEWR